MCGVSRFVFGAVFSLSVLCQAQIPEFSRIQKSSTNSSQIEVTLSNLSTTDTYTFATGTNLTTGITQDRTVQLGSTTTITVRVSATNTSYISSRISNDEDFDEDGLNNLDEFQTYFTDAENSDSDSDSSLDGYDPAPTNNSINRLFLSVDAPPNGSSVGGFE